MKNIFKIVLTVLLGFNILNAQSLSQDKQKNGYEVKLTSLKPLVLGNNTVFVQLSKDGTLITDAKMKMKIFMPEMPGMPYMEYKSNAKVLNEEYEIKLNFSMNGTWQYQLKFKTKDEKVHTIRGSVNL